jgi:hypothetical protein
MIPIDIIETIFHILLILGLVAFWIINFVTIYHLTRFGIGTQPKRFAAIFLFGSVFLSSAYVVIFSQLEVATLINLIH